MEQPAGLRAPLDPYEIREAQERKKRRDYDLAKQRRIQAEMMHKEEVKHRCAACDASLFHPIFWAYACMYLHRSNLGVCLHVCALSCWLCTCTYACLL
jgi:hypothetical protein